MKKISTRQGKLLAELLPTPKEIIAGLRGLFPKAMIVGWKFEADGKRTDVIAAGQKQLADCSTNFCVVNGPAYGEGFGLINKTGVPAHLANPRHCYLMRWKKIYKVLVVRSPSMQFHDVRIRV